MPRASSAAGDGQATASVTSSPRRSSPAGEQLPRGWAVARHDRLQLSQRSERPLRRCRAGAPHAARLRQADRRDRTVRGRALREQAADHGHGDGERAERARARARSHRREQPASRATSRSTACATCITEVVACFPVYRTYVDEHGWTADDRAVVERAIARARRRNPAMESSLFDFFREVCCRAIPNDAARAARPASGATATRRPTRPRRASGCASR